MINRAVAVIFLFLLTASSGIADPGRILKTRRPIVGEYIVSLRLAPTESVQDVAWSMALQHGGRPLHIFDGAFTGFGVKMSEQEAVALSYDPRVYLVEENGYGEFSATESFGTSDDWWHLDVLDNLGGITSSKSYSWTYDGTGIKIYVIDSGTQARHWEFDLDGTSGGPTTVTTGQDYYYQTNMAPDNPCGGYTLADNSDHLLQASHGTAVASLAAGHGYSLLDGVGVAKGATIVPIKVSPCSSTPNPTKLGVALALSWATANIQYEHKSAVINMSFYFDDDGGAELCAGTPCIPAIEYNIQRAIDAGAVVVTSANNQSGNYCTGQVPARMGKAGPWVDGQGNPEYYHTITVGGLTRQYRRLGISNFGPCVGIYSPGEAIRSANNTGFTGYHDRFSTFGYGSGTSWSSAIVAGLAARVLQRLNPTPSIQVARAVWDVLRNDAKALGANFDGDGVAANDIRVYLPATE